MMKTKSKKTAVWFSVVCLLSILAAGCGSSPESASRTYDVTLSEAIPEESGDTPSPENGDTQEQSSGKWQVLEPDIAAVVDADFMGKVWKIEEDSFFIAEKKVQILDDGSLVTSSPSSNADIPDSRLIQVVFDDDTHFYMRTVYGNGEDYEDREAGYEDLKEQMSIDMKGRFENDVFHADEIRLSDFA